LLKLDSETFKTISLEKEQLKGSPISSKDKALEDIAQDQSKDPAAT
jgi:hypothetical protein